MTADEAASLLGIQTKELAGLLERYGVGRHYEARHGDEFVYDREDIEKVKHDLEATSSGAAPPP
jgi:hypothetical protein